MALQTTLLKFKDTAVYTSPAGTMPPVSVIVPHYRHKTVLASCLSCLTQQDYEGRITVYVVDNSESYDLAELEARFPNFIFLWQKEAGSYNARNFALAHVRDEFIAFTDADCRPSVSWLRNGVTSLLADEQVGIVGGRIIVMPDNERSPSLTSFFEMATAFRQEDYVQRLNFVATANMFTRKTVFDNVGLFAAKQKSGGDYLWGTAVKAAGYTLAYDSGAVVEHPARDHAQLRQKIVRLAAGRRDMNPGWKSALMFALCSMMPPFHWFMAVLFYRDTRLASWKKPLLMCYCIYCRCLTGYKRLLLAFTKAPSPR